ncbi:protease HtpX [Congregibacter brevis]|uniref:Protease HtpX n=1 Tax=Congregibacter brevis TaxID=3081201 RepID=A0ABZ0IHY4_9GAMM|nr:protease HtpX [Congregibacter sp. IMCC45268]
MRILLFLATNFAVLILVGTVFTMLGFEGILAANGVDLNLKALLVFCGLFGMGGSMISLFLSKWMAKRGTGTYIIESPRNRDEQWLVDTVAELAQEAGIGMPEVGIFPSEAPNAFATGWNKNAALVAISAGMLKSFPANEIRAVIGHEIGHVANGDMVTLTLIQGVVNTFVMFLARIIGHTVDRVVFKTERGYGIGYFVVSIVAEIVLGILASIIVFKFSRWREFRADAAGASLAGRGDMIAALERLRGKQDTAQDLPGELTAFGISETAKQGFKALFSSHPPLDQRIAALRSAA